MRLKAQKRQMWQIHEQKRAEDAPNRPVGAVEKKP